MRTRSKNIGRFKHKIVLQYQSRVADGAGGWTNTWQDETAVWSQIEPLTGRESLEAEQLTGNQQFRFIVRYTDDFNATPDNDYRIKYGTRFFNIHSVQVIDFENQFFEIIGWEV